MREANGGSDDLFFGPFAAVGCGAVTYLAVSWFHGESLSDVRISLKGLLMLTAAMFVFVILGYAAQWWQNATAIPCRDDPRHQHVVCRLPNGGLRYWSHNE